MVFNLLALEQLGIQLIDGDRGKNYPKQHDFKDDGYCLFLSAKNVTMRGFEFDQQAYITKDKDNQLRAGKLQVNDVVLTTRGTIGNLAFYDKSIPFDHIRINSGMMILRASVERWNGQLLYFILTSEMVRQQISALTSGSAVPQLPARDIKKLLLPDIPRHLQDSIVSQLSALNEKITLNNQINQTLEQMAQALFKSWFVDFDPVVDNALDAGFFEQDLAFPDELLRRAEARRAVREHGAYLEKGKPLPDATRQLFPAAFEECAEPSLGLGGWVPQGWKHGCVADVARYSTQRIDTEELTLENYISTENMLADRKGIQPAANLPTVNSVPAYATGSILISNIRPYFKKIWLANGDGGHSNDVLGFEAKDSDTECYVFNLMYQDSFFDFMMATSKGSKMPRGDKKAILEWGLVVPPLTLRQYFSQKTRSFYKSSYGRHHENVTLTQLRDTLLPKLISGELRFDHIDAELTKEGVA